MWGVETQAQGQWSKAALVLIGKHSKQEETPP